MPCMRRLGRRQADIVISPERATRGSAIVTRLAEWPNGRLHAAFLKSARAPGLPAAGALREDIHYECTRGEGVADAKA